MRMVSITVVVRVIELHVKNTHRKMVITWIWKNITGIWMLLVLVSDKGDERCEHIHEVKKRPLEITAKCPSETRIPLSIESNAVGKCY